ncbi:MAG: hypothetical protein Q9177_000966 [Variospora cf. flavescens]
MPLGPGSIQTTLGLPGPSSTSAAVSTSLDPSQQTPTLAMSISDESASPSNLDEPPSSEGASDGTAVKIGAGVGTPLAVLLIACIIYVIYLRRRRRRKRQRTDHERSVLSSEDNSPEFPVQQTEPQMLENTSPQWRFMKPELSGETKKHVPELPAQSGDQTGKHTPELPVD